MLGSWQSTGLTIIHNMNRHNYQISRSMERLSSGLRINRAGDDPAGLAISEKMRGQIRGLNMAPVIFKMVFHYLLLLKVHLTKPIPCYKGCAS